MYIFHITMLPFLEEAKMFLECEPTYIINVINTLAIKSNFIRHKTSNNHNNNNNKKILSRKEIRK